MPAVWLQAARPVVLRRLSDLVMPPAMNSGCLHGKGTFIIMYHASRCFTDLLSGAVRVLRYSLWPMRFRTFGERKWDR